MSLTSLLTKVFIRPHSINYHPISKSHSETAALLLHGVKSVHLASPDTFMFADFVKLAATEQRKFLTKDPIAC